MNGDVYFEQTNAKHEHNTRRGKSSVSLRSRYLCGFIFKGIAHVRIHPITDKDMGAPAYSGPCFQEQTSRLEACAPRRFSAEVHER